MITINSLTEFLGWCTLINIVILLLSTMLLIVFKAPIIKIHSSMFALDKEALELSYFQYLGNYKIAIFLLNLAPYIALKIIV